MSLNQLGYLMLFSVIALPIALPIAIYAFYLFFLWTKMLRDSDDRWLAITMALGLIWVATGLLLVVV